MKKSIITALGLAVAMAFGACTEDHVYYDTAARAGFTLAGESYEVGQPIQFADASVPTSGTSIKAYLWEFGDADNSTSTEAAPSFTYFKDGTYIVKLTVTDSNGLKSTSQKNVVVTNPTKADFTLDQDEYYLGDEVKFTDNSTAKAPTTIKSWHWDFADGTGATSDEQNPTFKYAEAGSYPVTLTVTDSYGLTASITRSVNILDPSMIINLQWTAKLGGAVKGGSSAAMSPDGATVYMLRSLSGDDKATLSAFNTADGQLKWSFDLSEGMSGGSATAQAKDVFSSPSVGADGTIYMIIRDLQSTTAQRALYVLAVTPEGKLKWYHKGGVSGTNLYAVTPAIDATGNVYVATRGNEIWKLTAAGQGTVFSTDGLGVTGGLTLSRGGLLYAAANGKNGLFAMDVNTGARKWVYKTDLGGAADAFTGALRSAQASIGADGTAYFVTDTSTGGAVIAFNTDGSTKWIHATAGAIPDGGVAIAADGTIYANGGTAPTEGLIALNADGTRKWAFATEGNVMTNPVIDNRGYIHVIDARANYYVVKDDGTLFAQSKVGTECTSAPVMGPDGRIYTTVSRDGVPTVICVSSRAAGFATDAVWPMRGCNPQRTGLQK